MARLTMTLTWLEKMKKRYMEKIFFENSPCQTLILDGDSNG